MSENRDDLHLPGEVSSIHEALLRVSLAINVQLELHEILNHVVHYTRWLVGCEDASIILWDARLHRFETGASTTPVGATVAKRVRAVGGATEWIVRQRKPLIVTDVRQNPFTANQMIPESGIAAYIGVPVQQGADVLAVLYALSHRVRRFDDGEVDKMQALASMAAIAIRNAWLVQSLRELNHFRSAILRLAAHDLRHPLTVAKGYLEILLEEPASYAADQLEWLTIVQRSHLQMEESISSILDYDRLISEQQVELLPVDLNAIARTVAAEFEDGALRKSQQLTLVLAPHTLTARANEFLLHKALGNLVANAIKYTPPGGDITIRTAQNNDEGVVAVEDTGPGIPPDEIEQLFQPFVRLTSAKDEYGTGLGLSLVKTIVDRHGGRVTVESVLAEGSVFQIRLPLHPTPNKQMT